MKKKILGVILLLSMIMSNYSVGIVYATSDTYSVEYKIDKHDYSLYDNNGSMLLQQYYDNVVVLGDSENFNKINFHIYKRCADFENNIGEAIKQTNDFPPTENDYYLNYSDAEVTHNSNGIFSIKMIDSFYLGGVGRKEYRGLNYNLNTGEVLALTDIIPMSETEITAYFRAKTIEYIKDNPNLSWYGAWGGETAEEIVNKYTLYDFKYYIENNNIVLCYSVYELGAGAMGAITIPCPIIPKDKDEITEAKIIDMVCPSCKNNFVLHYYDNGVGDIVCPYCEENLTENDKYDDILNGDFSKVAGKYISNSGVETILLPNGLDELNSNDGEVIFRVENIQKNTDGSYSWDIISYYNGEAMDGVMVILWPEGVNVISYNGNILETDTSTIRLWSGNDVVSDVQYIFYKVDETIEENIATTITDEIVLKAEILNRNHSFDFYRNTMLSPAVKLNNAFRENSTQEWSTAYMFTYELSKVLSLNFPDIEKFDMKSYYEAVLTDILENDNDSIWSDFYGVWKSIYTGYNDKLLQEIIKSIPDFEIYKNSNLAKETDIEIVLDKIKNTKGEFKDIKIEKNLFETFGFCYDTITDTFGVIDEIYAYSAVQQEKIDVLNAIKNNTDNAELAKACQSVIDRIQDVHKSVVSAFLKNESIAVGENILELSQSVTVDLLLQIGKTTSASDIISSYSQGKLIMSAGRLATDLILNATSISKDTLTVAAYSDIENEIKECIKYEKNKFENNKNIDNARSYIATADIFKAALLTSCDLYSKCIKDVQRGDTGIEITSIIGTMGISAIIDTVLGNDVDYDAKIRQAENIKRCIIEADFYSTDGIDIVEFISEIVSTTPSKWAEEYVEWAIENNILPYDYLRGNYQNNITRAEFCTLLYYTISEYTGMDTYLLVEQSPYNPKIFKDSYYEYVYFMACLGIVNGVSETEFNPLGEITREEAAVMLYRAAKVVGYDVEEYDTSITKPIIDGISIWSTDGVRFVIDKNIMTGTGNGFEPQGKYTKEQAITTFVRFIQNLK